MGIVGEIGQIVLELGDGNSNNFGDILLEFGNNFGDIGKDSNFGDIGKDSKEEKEHDKEHEDANCKMAS